MGPNLSFPCYLYRVPNACPSQATMPIYLMSSLIVTSRQLEDPIDCVVEGVPSNVMDKYCWMHSFTKKGKSLKYYQWVYIMLLLQVRSMHFPSNHPFKHKYHCRCFEVFLTAAGKCLTALRPFFSTYRAICGKSGKAENSRPWCRTSTLRSSLPI